jgi:hypothetical protein
VSCAPAHPYLSVDGHRWDEKNETGLLNLEVEQRESDAPEGTQGEACRIAWGERFKGLQAGLGFADGQNCVSAGNLVKLDFYVRNRLAKPVAFTFRFLRESEWKADAGEANRIVIKGAVENPAAPMMSVVLAPGERYIVGHPLVHLANVVKMSREQRGCLLSCELRQRDDFGREGSAKPWSIELKSGELRLKVPGANEEVAQAGKGEARL